MNGNDDSYEDHIQMYYLCLADVLFLKATYRIGHISKTTGCHTLGQNICTNSW